MKTLILLAAAVALASSANVQAMEQKEKNLATVLLGLYGCYYGTIYSNILVHELGHAVAGKICYNKCKALIYAENPFIPFRLRGWCAFYNGSLTFDQKLTFIKLIQQKGQEESNDIVGFIKKHKIELFHIPHGLKGAAIVAAGPLAGLSYCAFLPFANTIFNEYLQTGSLKEAIQRAGKRNYLNDDQNLGILLGSMVSGVAHFKSLLPLKKGSDGYEILESLNLNRPAIRYSVIGAPFVGLGLFGYMYLNDLLNKK